MHYYGRVKLFYNEEQQELHSDCLGLPDHERMAVDKNGFILFPE